MPETLIDRKLIAELTEREEKRLEDSTPKSYELYKRAIKHMPMGVASTYQARDPYPVYFTHGKGSHVWTVDGQEIATSTTASAAWCRATPIPPSSRPSRSALRSAPSSGCPPRTRSSWPSTWPTTSGCRSGAS